ncbi:MAG TPA: abortive infection family protein [Thermoanaerobaculia bacterium]|jgi:hypothetical protein
MNGLTKAEIARVINDYIGVDGGYLQDFSYTKLDEFYPYYCDLDVEPQKLYPDTTTRRRFQAILETADAPIQARILRGLLAYLPPSEQSARRTAKRAAEIQALADRIERGPSVKAVTPANTSDVVLRAISDAEALLAKNGATSAVDRIHTALHGHLRALCEQEEISFTSDPTMLQLLKLLRQQHPALQNLGTRVQEISTVLNSAGAILDALNPVRNKASVAHPNPDLLEHDEAVLVIDIARSLMRYLDSKLG